MKEWKPRVKININSWHSLARIWEILTMIGKNRVNTKSQEERRTTGYFVISFWIRNAMQRPIESALL